MVSVCCENGDCFIIRDLIDADQFDQKIHMYFLVTVDFSEKNNVRLLGSFCQMSSEKDSPHPENLIVEKLIQRGLFQPEQN